LATATGAAGGATLRRRGDAALRAGFLGAATLAAAGLRAAAAGFFTVFDAFREAAAATALRLVSVFFPRVAFRELFGVFARFSGFELFFGIVLVPPRGTTLQKPANQRQFTVRSGLVPRIGGRKTLEILRWIRLAGCGRSVIFSDSASKIAQKPENSMIYRSDGES
jgi:hypothetical protein